MECPNCEIEMKFISHNFFMNINKKPIPFLVNDGDQHSVHMDTYVCTQCGLIHIPEEELKYIQDM